MEGVYDYIRAYANRDPVSPAPPDPPPPTDPADSSRPGTTQVSVVEFAKPKWAWYSMVEFVDKTVAAEPKRALSIPDVTELSRSARGYFAETYVLFELTGRGTMAELVPDRGGRMQCDLLVENGIRIEVKSSTVHNRNGGKAGRDSLTFLFTQDTGFVSTQYDFIVAVGFTEDGIMPYIVPPRVVEGQRRFRVRPTDKSHYSKYFDRWDLILEGDDRGERA